MVISKDFLFDTLASVVAELEQADPQSLIAARVRGLLDGRGMMLAAKADRHPRSNKAERDDKIAQAYLAGSSLEVIGRDIGIRPATVRAALIRRGVARRQSGDCQKATFRRRDDEKTQRIKAMRAAGKTLAEIGESEQITRERVRQILSRAGIDTRNRPLTLDEQTAVSEYAAGASLCETAIRHSLTGPALRKLIVRCGHTVRPSRKNGGHQPETIKKAERAAQLYAEGRTLKEMQGELGVNHAPGIYRLLAIAGVTIRARQVEQVA